MRRFAWLRVLLPGLCAGLFPACFSPAPSPYVRSGTPFELGGAPDANRAQQIARPAAPEESLTRIGYKTDAGRPPLVMGMSATGLPLRPLEEAPNPDKPQPVLLASGQRKATNQLEPATPRKLPKTITDEPALVAALKCYLEKRPSDATRELSKVDEATRDILLTLMPLTVRVGETGIAKADPQEIAVVVDQLQGLLWALRPKAALVMDKCCFCREIRRFGVFEALKAKPTFQPGQMVEVYTEVRNVQSTPYRSRRGDYRTHLRSSLDIRRPSGESAWAGPQRFDRPDDTLTPQHDYFQHYRLQVPPLEPGPYVLHLEVTDVPTGRTVRRGLEFAIGPSGGSAQSE